MKLQIFTVLVLVVVINAEAMTFIPKTYRNAELCTDPTPMDQNDDNGWKFTLIYCDQRLLASAADAVGIPERNFIADPTTQIHEIDGKLVWAMKVGLNNRRPAFYLRDVGGDEEGRKYWVYKYQASN